MVFDDKEEVPADFPQEFLGAVAGAQAKLLLKRTADGEYIDSASGQRRDRWLICVDLREQLVDYVHKHLPPDTAVRDYAESVARAVDRKRTQWGLSLAESAWVANQLRARFEQ